MIWFGWVLWHINHYWLFNAKSSLYIYIKYIWFGLVGFYGISTIVGYLMSIPLYTYIYIKYIWCVIIIQQRKTHSRTKRVGDCITDSLKVWTFSRVWDIQIFLGAFFFKLMKQCFWNFWPKTVLIFYSEQHHSVVTGNEQKKLSVLKFQIRLYLKTF